MSSFVTFIVTKKSDADEPLKLANVIFLTDALRQVVPCRHRHSAIVDDGEKPHYRLHVEFDSYTPRETRGDILNRAVHHAGVNHLSITEVEVDHAPLALTGP